MAFETARVIASQAFRVLEEWKCVPGSDHRGAIDGAALETWVKEARRLCAEAGRAEVGDSRIGQILSAAPRTAGETWPPEPVREVIEVCRSRDLERGFEVGVYNRRGVTVRLPTDGGEQEGVVVARREQLALQRRIVEFLRYRPSDADHSGAANVFPDRRAADADRSGDHPLARRQVRMQIVAEGYDPTIGYLHSSSPERQAFALDLMEPQRPIVDRMVLEFVQAHTFHPADFTIRSDGVCRLNPQMVRLLARRLQ